MEKVKEEGWYICYDIEKKNEVLFHKEAPCVVVEMTTDYNYEAGMSYETFREYLREVELLRTEDRMKYGINAVLRSAWRFSGEYYANLPELGGGGDKSQS